MSFSSSALDLPAHWSDAIAFDRLQTTTPAGAS
jgi:hypothetical protein